VPGYAQRAGNVEQHFVLRLGNPAAGKGGFHQDFQEHLPQILANRRVPGKGVQCPVQIEPLLLALVEQADRTLPVVTGNLHALHQRLDHANFVLGDHAIGLAQVAQRREKRIEERFLGGTHADDAGQETVDDVPQQSPDHSAADAAFEKAEHSPDNLAPPVTRNVE